jgi:2-keto-4-pentenoate hydratase/2-oxohepta-3-ene-1,7-dioic acid hydratase in catechol pathway
LASGSVGGERVGAVVAVVTEITQPRFGIVTLEDDGDDVPGVTTAQGAKTLEQLLGPGTAPTSLLGMLSDWDRWCERIDQRLDGDDGVGWRLEDDLVLRPPLADPPSIYCSAANFRDHITEMGVENPEEGIETPFHFLLPRASLLGHRGVISRPARATRLDWEVELAVVIGTAARKVGVDEALGYVAGYTVANDISMRDRDQIRHPWFGVRWLVSKGQTGFTPLGPAVVPARFIPDPMDLQLELSVNGAVKQSSSTQEMVFSVAEQVAFLSTLVELLPGDIILTGTPSGTGAMSAYLEVGDRVTARIAGVGTLINTIGSADQSPPVQHLNQRKL